QHVVGPERQRTRKAHLDAGPAIVVMARRDHRHAFDVEVELRKVGHRRKSEADVMHFAAAGEKPGHQGLLHGCGIPAVVVTNDNALWHTAPRKERAMPSPTALSP